MSAGPIIRPMGPCAVLVECGSTAQVLGLHSLLRQRAFPGVVDIVPAAETVLISCASPLVLPAIRRWLKTVRIPTQLPPSVKNHILDTVYDGADLAEAAGLASLSADALVRWHAGQNWVGAFGGFAPGFLYLAPTQAPLSFPRKGTPRTMVPAGSVAVGGEYSAIYPGPSPGGWQLLGRTAATLWNPSAASPALLQSGDTVRFNPVRELLRVTSGTPPREPLKGGYGLEVLSAGAQTTVQDLGRPGFAHLGVTGSGAVDRAALRRANRMAGNTGTAPGAAGLEIVLGGLVLQAAGPQIVAVAGTSVRLGVTWADGTHKSAPANKPLLLRNGETLCIDPVKEAVGSAALRSYLAVRGGLAMPAVLGSRSTDLLSGLGPAVLRAGTFLPVAPSSGIVGLAESSPERPPDVSVLRFLQGPRHDWFTPESLDIFEGQVWRTSADSNRIGLRLEPAEPVGHALARTEQAIAWELPSEGMIEGAIQVPPSGLPVLFLADHPVTGGYPVVGVVLAEDLDKAAALVPGAMIRFHKVSG